MANVRAGTVIGGTIWMVAALTGPSAVPSIEPSATPSAAAVSPAAREAARQARVDAVTNVTKIAKITKVTDSPATPPNDNANTGGDPTDNLPSLPGTGPNVTGLLMLSALLLLGGISARVTARRRAE